MTSTIALLGAGGKIGARIAELLSKEVDFMTLYVEPAPAGQQKLAALGLSITGSDEAVRQADVVIFAVPDILIGKIAADVVPQMKSGAMVMGLDPAAPYSDKYPMREDLSYFVAHPCHPPVYNDETDPAARTDYFGGIARQNIVCALHQGTEDDYQLGERIARIMFAPVMKAHRVTVEQMAMLEPALVETLTITCMMAIREGMDEIVKRGVPYEAARDFLLGHINIDIAILFDFLDVEFSDGAKLAAKRGMQQIFQPDWKKIFEPENIMQEVTFITEGA